MSQVQEMGVVLMAISDNQIRFALRLWESLAIGGKWILPNVGVYVKTGESTLTLTELHTNTVIESDQNLFDSHDWIVGLANRVGWVVFDDIQLAHDVDGKPRNIPENMIGSVAACGNGCGIVIRVEPPTPWVAFEVINDGECPHCKERGFGVEWNGVHVVVDDRSVRTLAQMQIEEE